MIGTVLLRDPLVAKTSSYRHLRWVRGHISSNEVDCPHCLLHDRYRGGMPHRALMLTVYLGELVDGVATTSPVCFAVVANVCLTDRTRYGVLHAPSTLFAGHGFAVANAI